MGFTVIAALLVWVVVVGPRDLALTGSLLGALLVLLGFTVLVKWPPQ